MNFSLKVEGNSLTFSDRLLSIRLEDYSGEQSDTLSLELKAGDEVSLPRTGVDLDLSLPTAKNEEVYMGKFFVDEISLSMPPPRLKIAAKAAPLGKDSKLKTRKQRCWAEPTLGSICESIAAEHGLTAAVASALAGVKIHYLEQNESDIHLLTRLAKRYGALAKIKGSHLLFLYPGKGETASGKALDSLPLEPAQVLSWSFQLSERESWKAVEARYYDQALAIEDKVSAGSGEPVLRLDGVYPSAGEAQMLAEATLATATRGQGELSIDLEGNPHLYAERPLELKGFRPEMAGRWIVSQATHRMDGSGYKTQIKAKRP